MRLERCRLGEPAAGSGDASRELVSDTRRDGVDPRTERGIGWIRRAVTVTSTEELFTD